MMKKSKTMLDEMQEQKLLKIEHRGCWIGFFGLVAAMYIQTAIGHNSFEEIGGEAIVLLVMALYIVGDSIRNGIWDRKLKPNLKTNLVISLITGLGVGGFWFVITYVRYHSLSGSLATFAMMFLFVMVMVLAALTLTAEIFKRRKRKLDRRAEEEDEE